MRWNDAVRFRLHSLRLFTKGVRHTYSRLQLSYKATLKVGPLQGLYNLFLYHTIFMILECIRPNHNLN